MARRQSRSDVHASRVVKQCRSHVADHGDWSRSHDWGPSLAIGGCDASARGCTVRLTENIHVMIARDVSRGH